MQIRTQISKTNPLVKKIIAVTNDGHQAWRGRLVTVVQVDPGWTYTIYTDSSGPRVYHVEDLDRRPFASAEGQPAYGSPGREIRGPGRGGLGYEVLVIRERGSLGSITIYVPHLDQGSLDVARDALTSGDKKHALTVLKNEFDDLAPLALAIIESQLKTFAAKESGKSSRQIDRELDEYLKAHR